MVTLLLTNPSFVLDHNNKNYNLNHTIKKQVYNLFSDILCTLDGAVCMCNVSEQQSIHDFQQNDYFLLLNGWYDKSKNISEPATNLFNTLINKRHVQQVRVSISPLYYLANKSMQLYSEFHQTVVIPQGL